MDEGVGLPANLEAPARAFFESFLPPQPASVALNELADDAAMFGLTEVPELLRHARWLLRHHHRRVVDHDEIRVLAERIGLDVEQIAHVMGRIPAEIRVHLGARDDAASLDPQSVGTVIAPAPPATPPVAAPPTATAAARRRARRRRHVTGVDPRRSHSRRRGFVRLLVLVLSLAILGVGLTVFRDRGNCLPDRSLCLEGITVRDADGAAVTEIGAQERVTVHVTFDQPPPEPTTVAVVWWDDGPEEGAAEPQVRHEVEVVLDGVARIRVIGFPAGRDPGRYRVTAFADGVTLGERAVRVTP